MQFIKRLLRRGDPPEEQSSAVPSAPSLIHGGQEAGLQQDRSQSTAVVSGPFVADGQETGGLYRYPSPAQLMENLFSRPDTKFSDSDLEDISRWLLHMGDESYSKIPRIYTVLRLMNQLQLIETFTKENITDFWFPFSYESLPSELTPTARHNFLNYQSTVLTKALDLERESGLHQYFSKDEPLPFEHLRYLGGGGAGEVDEVESLTSYKTYARKRYRRVGESAKAKRGRSSFQKEIEILKQLKHSHCVEYVGHNSQTFRDIT
jgi:hypothetical protein